MTISTTETDCGWKLKIDKEQEIDITPDQVIRLYKALGRIQNPADRRKRIRYKWKSIVDRDYQRCGEDGHQYYALQYNGFHWIISWGHGSGSGRKSFTMTPVQFIQHLREKDRPRAIEFFKTATKGKWIPE